MLLSIFKSFVASGAGEFPEQTMLEDRRALLLATVAAQVAHAKAARAAELERIENARIVAERERRAAEMGLAVSNADHGGARTRTVRARERTTLGAPRQKTGTLRPSSGVMSPRAGLFESKPIHTE